MKLFLMRKIRVIQMDAKEEKEIIDIDPAGEYEKRDDDNARE